MSLAIWFWLLFVIGLFFGWWGNYDAANPYPYRRWGGSLLIFVLIGLLGYATFGGPISSSSNPPTYYQSHPR